MKKISAVILTLALAVSTAAAVSSTAYAANVIYAYKLDNPNADSAVGPGMSGWKQNAETGAWQYYRHGGAVVSDWVEDGGHRYYLNTDGNMVTGWITIDGTDYFLNPNASGSRPLGAAYLSEKTPDGTMVDARGARISSENRRNPYGYTCVEVDLTAQTVYAYQGDALVIAAPCVTGNSSNHATPPGSFTLKSKETARTLRGYNDNGSKYASFVNFWMPFNGGIGLHDASWRSSFGGGIYQGGGSHGCVNLPYNAAATIYNMAYVGMPVIVHY